VTDAALVEAAARLGRQGLLPATAGNLSVRRGEGCRITRSGVDKGLLTPDDLLDVAADGTAIGGGRPSAETALHLAVYRRFPEVGAVVHTHGRAATLASLGGDVTLAGWELLKALEGHVDPEQAVTLRVHPNDQDLPRLARVVEADLAGGSSAPGFLLRAHGLYAWGRTVADATRHAEALEFVLGCVLVRRGIPC
jgi:methylthioribulose-1-phosphate dehydratase